MLSTLKKSSLYLAWLVALAGTLTSLYLSEIQHMPICNLCWYQRICLYPLVIILGMACYHNDKRIAKYVLPLTLIGMLFAIYQYMEQMIPGFAPLPLCGTGLSCDTIHVQLLGFVTLPLLSAMSFMVLSALMVLALKR